MPGKKKKQKHRETKDLAETREQVEALQRLIDDAVVHCSEKSLRKIKKRRVRLSDEDVNVSIEFALFSGGVPDIYLILIHFQASAHIEWEQFDVKINPNPDVDVAALHSQAERWEQYQSDIHTIEIEPKAIKRVNSQGAVAFYANSGEYSFSLSQIEASAP